MIAVKNYDVIKGDTFKRYVYIKNAADNSAVDLTGVVAECEVRTNPGAELIAQITCAVTAAEGKIEMTMSALQTALITEGFYKWDLKLTSESSVRHIAGGEFDVIAPITE